MEQRDGAERGRVNKYSESVFTIDEAITMMQEGVDLKNVIVDSAYEIEKFQIFSSHLMDEEIILKSESEGIDVEEYHEVQRNRWNFPDKYKSIDVLEYLLGKTDNPVERERVIMEYKMYEERELIVLLQFLIWLVDHMREHDILWGVGRGSSVSSLCLYLIGINRVNPLKYNLDIHEFLK